MANVPTIQAKPNYGVKNALIGGGLLITGGAIGYSIDHWVIPFLSKKAREERREARKARKAEKEARRAAKKNGKKPTAAKPAEPKTEPEPAKPEKGNVKVNPDEDPVEIE